MPARKHMALACNDNDRRGLPVPPALGTGAPPPLHHQTTEERRQLSRTTRNKMVSPSRPTTPACPRSSRCLVRRSCVSLSSLPLPLDGGRRSADRRRSARGLLRRRRRRRCGGRRGRLRLLRLLGRRRRRLVAWRLVARPGGAGRHVFLDTVPYPVGSLGPHHHLAVVEAPALGIRRVLRPSVK